MRERAKVNSASGDRPLPLPFSQFLVTSLFTFINCRRGLRARWSWLRTNFWRKSTSVSERSRRRSACASSFIRRRPHYLRSKHFNTGVSKMRFMELKALEELTLYHWTLRMYIHHVRGKRDQNVFRNIFYKTPAILMKFWCPEKDQTKLFFVISPTKPRRFWWNLVRSCLNKFAAK